MKTGNRPSSDLVCRQGNPSCDCRQFGSIASGVYCVKNQCVIAFVAALAIWSAGTIECAMISGKWKHNCLLRRICLRLWQVCDFCTFERSVIFATMHTPTGFQIFTMRTPTGFRILTMHMINSGRACIPFGWLFLVHAHPQSNSLREPHEIPTLPVWIGSQEISCPGING